MKFANTLQKSKTDIKNREITGLSFPMKIFYEFVFLGNYWIKIWKFNSPYNNMMSMKFDFTECYMGRTGFSSQYCIRSSAGITCHNSSGTGIPSELM